VFESLGSNVMCMWFMGRKGTHSYGSSKTKSCLKEFISREFLNVGIFVMFLSSILIISVDNVSDWNLWVTIITK
jgi:hypothetical protein